MSRHAVGRTVLLYGLVAGVLVAALQLMEYRLLVLSHALELYGALVAALFAALGILLGRRLTRPAADPAPAPVPVPAAPRLPDPARREALGITAREHEILALIAEGLSTREMAGRLGVSENTVKTHTGRLLAKLRARRRTEAVRRAQEEGLLS
ncbi:helix-turn-helix transcriptional regulator [Roseisolibacter sp. H3M3-2]|uniref:response regulator transcription factor n=1 Tax=Roseisolibacter sp. H3M3-2 TaxID=3031323 RepID=UPI0023DC210F|nr:helix-turn-helix transcriptional regulator [Roseisolibacter sp. H3M3-2]MDF1503277.1 helix-turn-helix transcriptional regulator [Roseisolibacter sp. H3M3-2]